MTADDKEVLRQVDGVIRKCSFKLGIGFYARAGKEARLSVAGLAFRDPYEQRDPDEPAHHKARIRVDAVLDQRGEKSRRFFKRWLCNEDPSDQDVWSFILGVDYAMRADGEHVGRPPDELVREWGEGSACYKRAPTMKEAVNIALEHLRLMRSVMRHLKVEAAERVVEVQSQIADRIATAAFVDGAPFFVDELCMQRARYLDEIRELIEE
jgi:hypothetical protein